MPRPPWQAVAVALMTAGVAVFQFPFYNIPWLFAPLYFVGCGLLAWGFYAGWRVAFVINVVTVWIFPLETYLGIKPLLRGSALSVLHVIALVLLVAAWQHYWNRREPR